MENYPVTIAKTNFTDKEGKQVVLHLGFIGKHEVTDNVNEILEKNAEEIRTVQKTFGISRGQAIPRIATSSMERFQLDKKGELQKTDLKNRDPQLAKSLNGIMNLGAYIEENGQKKLIGFVGHYPVDEGKVGRKGIKYQVDNPSKHEVIIEDPSTHGKQKFLAIKYLPENARQISIEIAESYRNKGYGQAMTKLYIEWFQKEYPKDSTLYATIDDIQTNIASIKTLTNTGFSPKTADSEEIKVKNWNLDAPSPLLKLDFDKTQSHSEGKKSP